MGIGIVNNNNRLIRYKVVNHKTVDLFVLLDIITDLRITFD